MRKTRRKAASSERPFLDTPPPGVSAADWGRSQALLPPALRGLPPGEALRRWLAADDNTHAAWDAEHKAETPASDSPHTKDARRA